VRTFVANVDLAVCWELPTPFHDESVLPNVKELDCE
jgi:hypothetical protein